MENLLCQTLRLDETNQFEKDKCKVKGEKYRFANIS